MIRTQRRLESLTAFVRFEGDGNEAVRLSRCVVRTDERFDEVSNPHWLNNRRTVDKVSLDDNYYAV